jgi:ABC-type multidrug transport system fused ATPase/permease subunit
MAPREPERRAEEAIAATPRTAGARGSPTCLRRPERYAIVGASCSSAVGSVRGIVSSKPSAWREPVVSPALSPMPASGAPLLEASHVSKHYRGLVALADYSVVVAPGSIHGIIGPNGAGKTTLFNLLSGMVRPSTGSIRLQGTEITGLPPTRSPASGSLAPSRTSGCSTTCRSSTTSRSPSADAGRLTDDR